MRKSTSVLLGLAALVASSQAAQAQDLRWYGITGNFNNIVWQSASGNGWNQTASGGMATLNWGANNSDSWDRSSYKFQSQPAQDGIEPAGPGGCGNCSYQTLDLTPGPTVWKIGTFTHVNKTIPSNGRVLDKVDLALTFQFDVNGLNTNPLAITQSASFNINHSETSNPSGDDVIFNLPGSETVFSYNGFNYGLSLYSMMQNKCTGNWWNQTCADVAVGGFDTPENGQSVGDLYAKIRLVPDVQPDNPPTSTVPEPSTYVLMASGLAALAAVSKRRKAQQTA